MGAPKGHPPYPGCEKGGRPREWNDEVLNELADNLLDCIEKCRTENKPFWWKDWAFDVDVDPNKCSLFAQRSEKFQEAYNKANNLQEWQVTKGALYKKFNSNFAQFFLMNRHPELWKSHREELTENGRSLVINTVQYADTERNPFAPQVPTEVVPTSDSPSTG